MNVEQRAALQEVIAGEAATPEAQRWYEATAKFIEFVQSEVTKGSLEDAAVLDRLFNDESISTTGMGRVKLTNALDDAQFRAWFAQRVTAAPSQSSEEFEHYLISLHDELASRLRALCGRNPWLKLRRALCALFPRNFTSIVDHDAPVFELHRRLTGEHTHHYVSSSMAIRQILDAELSPSNADEIMEQSRRINLPWMYLEHLQKQDKAAVAGDSVQQAGIAAPAADGLESLTLIPHPATSRRKGLTSIGGGFDALMDMLEDLKDGLSRDEFFQVVKNGNPRLGNQAVTTTMNVVAREFDLCIRNGDLYTLSERGRRLLQTRNPDVLADHLLTKVLALDNVLKLLEEGPEDARALIAFLQEVNPGWTTTFAPTSQLGWLRELGLVDYDRREYRLTQRGHRWAALVTWKPEKLPALPDNAPEVAFEPVTSEPFRLPTFPDLLARLRTEAATEYLVDEDLVARLHAGLWFHPQRHFAVLTGISGSGKTQLALRYTQALTGDAASDSPYVKVVAVSPGWHDPSALLGYVNPLQEDSYRSAPFLDLLLRARADPGRPYVAILDEMNLSHPEQYFAPILSAMESSKSIDLHNIPDAEVAIPRSVAFPKNLAIIGTLNMDETTHGLSDKVLDRAFTLEFWQVQIDSHPVWKRTALSTQTKQLARAVLNGLEAALMPCRLHFGMRTVDDVIGFVHFQEEMGRNGVSALDEVVFAKILPKLRGEQTSRFQLALTSAEDVLRIHGLVRCSSKIKEMQESLRGGSASFWR